MPVSEQRKDLLLARYPQAKCDVATTGTVELLPRDAKDALSA